MVRHQYVSLTQLKIVEINGNSTPISNQSTIKFPSRNAEHFIQQKKYKNHTSYSNYNLNTRFLTISPVCDPD